MSKAKTSDLSLEDLAALAVTLGRELERDARDVGPGDTGTNLGFVRRALSSLADRAPFDPQLDASFEAAYGMLEDDLRSEIVALEDCFVETHYDADGQHGQVRSFPVYSPRGNRLAALREKFGEFLKARAKALDCIAAEREVRRLLAG